VNLQEIIEKLHLKVLTDPIDFSQVEPTSGYTSDLLSCVMAGAKKQGIWVTLMAHGNIVAVAALLEISAVIITEDAVPEPATIARANSEGITLLSSPHPSFEICGQLWDLGLRSE
jgi:hypothetical protein